MICSAAQVGLLQNAAFAAQGEGMTVTGALGDEHGEGANMITITGEDGLVYQVRIVDLKDSHYVVLSIRRTDLLFVWIGSQC